MTNVAGRAGLANIGRMKPRHAAALALVSWYLVEPPPGYKGSQAVLSGWYNAKDDQITGSSKRSPADYPPKCERHGTAGNGHDQEIQENLCAAQ